jgi:peptidoglycan/xylan/chitin deacetylase (PgdA/CDA1 family)
MIALTFHGNGDPQLAERLLRLLESRHARGTVLAVGTWLATNPSMAARITDAGHELGNHTQHHLPMRGLTATHAYTEIKGCADELRARTGSIGTWFRASGTQRTTPTIRRAAARAGYGQCVSYDVDGLDWRDPPTATVVRAVLSGVRNGSIVSLHLGHPVTVDALPAILDRLPSRGLRPVTLTELLG